MPRLDLGLTGDDPGQLGQGLVDEDGAAGESGSPGRPIALRMSCSWVQMSKVRIIATVDAGAARTARG